MYAMLGIATCGYVVVVDRVACLPNTALRA
jgi:hypothetical protein